MEKNICSKISKILNDNLPFPNRNTLPLSSCENKGNITSVTNANSFGGRFAYRFEISFPPLFRPFFARIAIMAFRATTKRNERGTARKIGREKVKLAIGETRESGQYERERERRQWAR